MSKSSCIKFFPFLVGFVFFVNTVNAQVESDIYEMDLESLMQLSIRRTSVLGLPQMQNKGEIQIKYSYIDMEMSKTYNGTGQLEVRDILKSDFIAPNSLHNSTHNFRALFSFSDEISLNVASAYRYSKLNSVLKYSTLLQMAGVQDPKILTDADKTNFLGSFDIKTQGFTDSEISLFINAYSQNEHSLLINGGVMLPTGSLQEIFTTPVTGDTLRAPYPLQFGSGTFDPIISLTYLNASQIWSTGFDIGTVQRLYNNSEGYSKGNEYWIKVGTAYNIDKLITVSTRLDFAKWDNYKGQDRRIEFYDYLWNIARANARGGVRLNGSVGVSIDIPKGVLKGHKLTLDYRAPLYQDLNGPQLNESNRLVFTWSNVFGAKRLD